METDMLLCARLPAFWKTDILGALRRVIVDIAEMRQAVAGRRAIARMDARMLADIGLSRAEAQHEVNRLPWDIAARDRK
jgi:uncharacterized protein YjiS (DUF1127 family)